MNSNTAITIIILAFACAICFTVYHTNSGWWVILLFLACCSIESNDTNKNNKS